MIEFIESLTAQWQALPVQWRFVVAYLLQFAIFVFFAAGITLLYSILLRVFKHGVLLDARPLRPNQIRFEVSYSLITRAICAVYTVVGLSLSRGVWPESWLTGVLQVVVFLLFYDIYFYWTHPLFHTPSFIRFHGIHHRSVRVTPWAVHSLHPVEAAVIHLPVLLFMLMWPTSISGMLFFHGLLMSLLTFGHSNFDPYPNRNWLRGVKEVNQFHQEHHKRGEPSNFGFLSLFWDRVFGTVYEQKRKVV